MTLEVKILNCLHCGYEWVQRFDRKPKACPKCCNINYDQPRKHKEHTRPNSPGSTKNILNQTE